MYAFNFLPRSYIRSGRVQDVMKACDHMGNLGLKPYEYAFSWLIDAIIQENHPDLTRGSYSDLRKTDHCIDKFTLCSILGDICTGNDIKLAWKLLGEWLDKDEFSNLFIFVEMMNGL